MFNSRRYELTRLLWVMKTTRSWMRKVGFGIAENAIHRSLNKDINQWLEHSREIKGAADIQLTSWIEELERVIEELNEELNEELKK